MKQNAVDPNFALKILDTIADPIFVKDRSHTYVHCNNAFLKLMEREFKDVVGKSTYYFHSKEFADIYCAKDDEVFSSDEINENKEEIARPNGERITALTKKAMLRNETGDPFLVGVIRDITQLERTESLLRQQERKLMHASKMSTFGEMATNIGHEINNPLTVILGRTQQSLRLSETQSPVNQALVGNLKKIEMTSLRIVKIINALQSFSRDGKKDPLVSTNVGTVIEETLDLCRERFRQESINLKVTTMSDQHLLCRTTEISQALLNLLNNSRDAISFLPIKWIKIEAKVLEKNIELSITDSGPGIPPEIAQSITQPFFTTKPVGKGTGLGLSISKMIIEEHGGEFFLDQNSPNTRFVIRLPLSS